VEGFGNIIIKKIICYMLLVFKFALVLPLTVNSAFVINQVNMQSDAIVG
jgi:hypothetical protein